MKPTDLRAQLKELLAQSRRLEDECAEQAKDWEEVLEQRAEEKMRLKESRPRRVIEVLLFVLGLATIVALAYFLP